MSTHPAPWQGPDAGAVRPALAALREARKRTAGARPHRGLVRIEPGFYAVQALLLPALFIALLLRFEPELVHLWREFVTAWAGALGLPLRPSMHAAGTGELRLVWDFLSTATVLPGDRAIAMAAAITLATFAATFAMPPRLLPVKYLLRLFCAVQAISVAFFALGGEFPYSVADHVLALSSAGFVLLAAIPLMLAMGYYVLRVPLMTKLLHTAMIVGYFIVWVPLQIVVHVVLLHYLGAIVMPLLFFCFGTLLDFVLFVALYSWVASTTPLDATA